MQFAAVSIIIVGILAYIWASRGFFSALLHLACTVAAGAIAFALWEPLAHLILSKAPVKASSVWMVDVAWGAALAVPFLVSLALLRLGMDKFIIANAKCSDTVDFVGGLACGAGAGIITAGIVVMSLGMLRFKPDMLGYASVGYTDNAQARGAVQRERPMLRPYADEITGRLYAHLSNAAFRPIGDDPLAKWYPNVSDVPSTLRMTFDGKSRNTTRPSDVVLTAAYTVGDRVNGENVAALIRPQSAIDQKGNAINKGYLGGFVVSFLSGAKEKTAQVVVGAGQVRLLCEKEEGGTDELHPVAVISQADPSRPELGRWRYDAAETFIASIGGANEARMAFEFAIPAGWTPLALYVKNARILLGNLQIQELPSVEARDQEIARRFDGVPVAHDQSAGGDLGTDFKFPKRAGTQPSRPRGEVSPDEIGIRQTNTLGFAMRKGAERGLSLVEDERAGFAIIDGNETFSKAEIQAQVGTIDQKIRVAKFAVTQDVVMVQIDVSNRTPLSLIGEAGLSADPNSPAYLTDTDGQRYECVGFVYKDDLYYQVRYTPSVPVGPIKNLPELTVSKPTASLVLLFRVNFGVNLNRFMVGSTVIGQWDETPLTADQRQR